MDPKLAIDGGEPVFPDGFVSWPKPDRQIEQQLMHAYSSGDWGRYHGQNCEQLRSVISNYHDNALVQLCSSGTIAVELGLRAVGVGEGDKVVLAGYDFSGNFRAIENLGAKPVLIDVLKNGWTINFEQLAEVTSDRTKAILVSHLHSDLAAMQAIQDFAKQRGVAVVEDACQSPGAKVQAKTAGLWGDVGVLSFGGSKLLSSGRGGAVFTKQESLFQRIKIYCERGNDAYALSELQAAVLIPQWQQLDRMNEVRYLNASRVIEETKRLSLFRERIESDSQMVPSFFKVSWLMSAEAVLQKERITAAMRAEGVDMNFGFRGFTKRSERRCLKPVSLPESETASNATLLLHHPILLESSSIIDRLIFAIKKVSNAWNQGSSE